MSPELTTKGRAESDNMCRGGGRRLVISGSVSFPSLSGLPKQNVDRGDIASPLK